MNALRPQDPVHIGTYALLGRLGAGGMGQVYLGRSPGGRLVAIKVIREEIVDHPGALARFRREVETVRAVRSAYTASLIDASLDAAPYWLATEYVSGPTLSKAAEARGPLPAETCRGVFAALAEGLAAVHAYGVTHRDLKPQNVILSAQGPQLIDFGIARGAGQTALTELGYASGTPGFTAPEVLLRNETAPAADVFALGATMAYAATGRPPFGHGEAAGVSYRAVHEDIDVAGLDPHLAELIRACVAKDPGARPGLQEVVARCSVRSALAEDPTYAALVALAEPAPRAPTAPGTPTAPGFGPAEPFTQTGLPPAPPPPGPYAYTPTQLSAPGAPAKRRTWLLGTSVGLGAAALAVVAVLLAQGLGDGDRGTEAKDDGKKSPTASEAPKKSAPAYIDSNVKVSRDFWTADPEKWGGGECNLPPEERQEADIVHSVDPDPKTGKAHITFRTKPMKKTDRKYYLSVAVKPPHEIDSDTGKPYDFGTGPAQQNLNLGYTSKPFDLYSLAGTSDDARLTYPDDFAGWFRGKKKDEAIPLGNDPGDWTVQFLHVEKPREYASVVCTGFTWK
ncbi:putative serine/threonine protein kinase [Streptomyces himastatinicus ATCC 53653]|uniref:Putative serine/threonine protein kinase n=1 Tax=Streptomyces himastatinicus ATCC 53653 TaxID=457427 RepID=D9W8T1_9ACTN|nr:serine/threonine-protein kinase [Streptomyces himastatinicus]EFL24769.1 putative serine/threonine protein kinase [Streptomyces himastatinicus ATCC 53653]